LNAHNVSDDGQINTLTSKPLKPRFGDLEVEITIAKFKKCKSPGNNQIPAELIQAISEILVCDLQTYLFHLE
jgi:hypothetical protein